MNIVSFLQENLDRLVQTAAVIGALWIGYVLIERFGRRFVVRVASLGHEDTARAETLWSMLRRLLIIGLVATLLLMLLATWGVSIAPLLAVGSAVGVALGFGAQSLVKDVIAGFFILAEDQYRIGDVVRIAGVAGVVEDIRPRVTVLRDLDGNVHYVPNGSIEVASNLTQVYAQVVIDVGVAYKEDVDDALAVLDDELKRMAADPEWAEVIIEEPQVLGVDQLADSAVVLRGLMKVTAGDRWRVKREALRRIKKRFDAEGIEIPFPHLTIYKGGAGDAQGEGTATGSASRE